MKTGNLNALIISGGSKITISSHSFEDLNGKLVDGWVEIKYKEFKNPAQILLSGISTEYDSGGVKRDFESAGMFEIYGSAKGTPIKISTGKKLPESKNFDPKTTEKSWNDIEIEMVKGTDKLLMTFSNDQEQNQVVAQIKNLDGKNLKKIYSAYLSRKEQMGERVNANARENRNAQVKDSTTIAENKGREETEATVYRTFSVLQFGIFNSDCVAMMPKGMIVKASFNKIDGRNIEEMLQGEYSPY